MPGAYDTTSYYNHLYDDTWTCRGKTLHRDRSYIQGQFRIILLLIFVFEVFANAWPLTATILYKQEAFITWFWFIYAIRVILLIGPFVKFENILHIYGAGNYKGFIHWGRIPAAFTPSTPLYIWVWISILIGGLAGTMVTLASIASWPLYDSYLLGGLSIAFSVLFCIQSLISPFVLYWFGVWTPIENARK